MGHPTPATDLFALLPEPFTAEAVFDCLPDVVYFVKNERAEYVVVNRTLVERCAAGDKGELIGRTAEDAFPPPMGRTFREQDEALLRSGEPIRDQLDLHLYPSGREGWCVTNKLPLRDANGRVVGLVGVSHDVHPPDERGGEFASVAAAVEYARGHTDRRLGVAELAEVAGLSAYQLDQRVRRLFRLTTGQLLLKVRMDAALKLLRDTDRPLAQVGMECGYADQSAFSRQFKQTTGRCPGEYRRSARAAASVH
jgi:AraC-like DNA-binding protein